MIQNKIYSGQYVRISFVDEILFMGLIDGNDRSGDYATDTKVIYQYTACGINAILNKKNSNKTYTAYTTPHAIALDIANKNVSAGITDDGDIYEDNVHAFPTDVHTDGKTDGEVMDMISELTGYLWWIDTKLALHFQLDPVIPGDIEEAPYDIDDDFGTFDDYRNLSINEDYTNYANWIFISGGQYKGVTIKTLRINNEDYDEFLNICGYSAGTVYALSDTNILSASDINVAEIADVDYIEDYTPGADPPDVDVGDVIYNATRKTLTFVSTGLVFLPTLTAFWVVPTVSGQTAGDKIWYNKGLNDTAKSLLQTKSSYPPIVANFHTFTAGFKPRQRLYINSPRLDVMAYFNIKKVEISEYEAGKFNFNIEAEKKDYSDFSNKTQRNYSEFFSKN